MPHRLLNTYPKLDGNFLFLDVNRVIPTSIYPLLNPTPSDTDGTYRWKIWNDIKDDYLTASDDDFYFTWIGHPCEEAAADKMWFKTSLLSGEGQPIWLYAELNKQPKSRWFVRYATVKGPRTAVVSSAPAPTASAPTVSAQPAASVQPAPSVSAEPEEAPVCDSSSLLELYPNFFDLVFLNFYKVQERLIPLVEDSTLTWENVRNALITQYREKGLEACRFTRKGKACSPQEADTLLFFTGFQDRNGNEIRLQCERNTNKRREPWFGKYFNSDDWEERRDLEPFIQKVFIFESTLNYGLTQLIGNSEDLTASANEKRTKIAKHFLDLAPEEIQYFNNCFRTNDEAEATQMVFPTGYTSPEGEEIMLCCARNRSSAIGQPWISRNFFLPSQNSFFGRAPGEWLLFWARFKAVGSTDITEELTALKNMAIDEVWSLRGERDLSILRNYLFYTFARLWREQKIEYSDDGRYAAFNTGLVNRAYEYIYALFIRKPVKNGCREWQFLGFCLPSQDYYGKTLSRLFFPLPKPARYFKDDTPIYYSFNDDLPASAQIPGYDAEHILLERTYRLPSKFLLKYADRVPGLRESLLRVEALSPEDKPASKKLWKAIGALLRDSDVYRDMKDDLDKAVETAVKRAAWNYRTVIPYYSPKDDTISLLLPISLTSGTTPDAAMVLEPRYGKRTGDGRKITHYMGHTIITLAMAYGNSRLVCRPESDWLNTNAIFSAGDTQPLDLDDEGDEED